MSLIKAAIAEEKVLLFLRENIDDEVSEVTFIKGGELSQAFSYISQGNDYIIRVNKSDEFFKKDAYASVHFASASIPIPTIQSIGRLDETLFYCISEKAHGYDLGTIKEGFGHIVYPQLMTILDAIHTIQLKPGNYGWWVEEGEAHYNSWQDYITKNTSYLSEIYDISMLERDICELVFAEIEKLAHYLPEERHLIHGDFGGNNAIFDGKKITGIIDWGNSAYGDFLYDAANQEYWVGKNMARDVYFNHYKENDWNIEHFDERIQCYLLSIGAGVMGFYAKAGMEDHYQKSRKRMLEILSSGKKTVLV